MQVPAAGARIMLKAARAIRSMALVSHSAQSQMREDRQSRSVIVSLRRAFSLRLKICDISSDYEMNFKRCVFISLFINFFFFLVKFVLRANIAIESA